MSVIWRECARDVTCSTAPSRPPKMQLPPVRCVRMTHSPAVKVPGRLRWKTPQLRIAEPNCSLKAWAKATTPAAESEAARSLCDRTLASRLLPHSPQPRTRTAAFAHSTAVGHPAPSPRSRELPAARKGDERARARFASEVPQRAASPRTLKGFSEPPHRSRAMSTGHLTAAFPALKKLAPATTSPLSRQRTTHQHRKEHA
jgi:hypothetical protein